MKEGIKELLVILEESPDVGVNGHVADFVLVNLNELELVAGPPAGHHGDEDDAGDVFLALVVVGAHVNDRYGMFHKRVVHLDGVFVSMSGVARWRMVCLLKWGQCFL